MFTSWRFRLKFPGFRIERCNDKYMWCFRIYTYPRCFIDLTKYKFDYREKEDLMTDEVKRSVVSVDQESFTNPDARKRSDKQREVEANLTPVGGKGDGGTETAPKSEPEKKA
jgi:hypothetical protein